MVTGRGRGFGRATAYSYAFKGAKVIIASRIVMELVNDANQVISSSFDGFLKNRVQFKKYIDIDIKVWEDNRA